MSPTTQKQCVQCGSTPPYLQIHGQSKPLSEKITNDTPPKKKKKKKNQEQSSVISDNDKSQKSLLNPFSARVFMKYV